MADYVLTQKADQDITEIYRFSYEQFSVARADAYLQALEERFVMLAEQPLLGQKIDHIRAGYFRYHHARHSIFYTLRAEGVILIVRVLHSSMDIEQHL